MIKVLTVALGALKAFVSIVGWPMVFMLLIVGYYEGVPWLKHVPFIGVIPLAGDIIVGEKQRYADAQSRLAVAGMVEQAKLDAANALLKKAKDEAAYNARMADAARKQADNAKVQLDAKEQELEKRIAADNDPADSRWTEHDLERLSEH